MPLVLALETSTAIATATLARVRQGAARMWWDWESDARNLQTSFFSAIEEGYRAVQGTPEETTAVVVGIGPGSFTGVKLALGFAKTLAQLTPACALYGIPSWVGALPEDLPEGLPIAWTTPSTRTSSYLVAAILDEEEALAELSPVGDYPNAEIARVLAELGSAGLLLHEPSPSLPLPGEVLLPPGWSAQPVEAGHSGRLLELYLDAGEEWEPADPLTLLPEYVRPPQATLVRRPRLFPTPETQ